MGMRPCWVAHGDLKESCWLPVEIQENRLAFTSVGIENHRHQHNPYELLSAFAPSEAKVEGDLALTPSTLGENASTAKEEGGKRRN